jgi:epsin
MLSTVIKLYKFRGDGRVVLEVLDKRLNDSGKNWRHVYKSLLVYQYLLENGPEYIINHCKKNLHVIKTLREYQHIDEKMMDQGQKGSCQLISVRSKSREVTELLTDESKLREARANRNQTRERLYGDSVSNYSLPRNGEDEDLKRAIELSKQEAAAEERRRRDRQE